MKSEKRSQRIRLVLAASLLLGQILRPVVHAGQTDLADEPLNNATKTKVLPNILILLDDSYSMSSAYLPDYVRGYYCRGASSVSICAAGTPPYYLSSFNSLYYDPMIDYVPPRNADGTTRTSYTAANSANWTRVPDNGYKSATATQVDIVSNWPEQKACRPGLVQCTSQVVAQGTSMVYAYPDSRYSLASVAHGAPFYYTATVEWCPEKSAPYNYGVTKVDSKGTINCQANKDSKHTYVRYSNWQRVDIVPTRNVYPGPRGTTRTYEQEMTNFANWHAWYRTRMLMAKTSLSLALSNVRGLPNEADPKDYAAPHARVGLAKINSWQTMGLSNDNFLAIDTFDAGPKALWYQRLNDTEYTEGNTPSRMALHKASRIFAGKQGQDPVQYSCQRNFIILTSDGYWNDDQFTLFPGLDNRSIADADGKATRPSFDIFKASSTLADIAYYYYHTDLRTPELKNCTGAMRPDGTAGDVCTNDVSPSGSNPDVDDVATHQHVTTFTIGLGMDGLLPYRPDYKTSTVGAYFNILQATQNWPDPWQYSDGRVDDLWHAAVNGRGIYFSARDPASLQTSLQAALLTTQTANGAGGAAASSDQDPTDGEEGSGIQYVPSYRTRFWDGDVAARAINLNTAAISEAASWKASPLLDARITNPPAETGAPSTDTRTIYVSVDNVRKRFEFANLNDSQKKYFDNARLSQYATWGAGYQAAASGTTLVNYLRGHAQYEDQSGSAMSLYRDREHVLGDIVHSQPIYVKKSAMTFDAGHDANYGNRMGMLYVAANDGMLHAFCTETAGNCTPGKELWAYVIPTALPNMAYLADKRHASEHRYLVDGRMMVADVYFGGSWKTILVGGLGKGGRGYYAFDITAPDDPKLLWTFTASDNPNLGYSYGSALVTKVDVNGDGVADNSEWRVIVPSGYNNVPGLPNAGDATKADGGGYLFMLDPATGAVRESIATGNGSVTSPSGLAHIQLDVPTFNFDNSSEKAYGGDLNGDLWRFDLKARKAEKIISLGASRPITTAVEVTLAQDGIVGIYFGSGRYLGIQDLKNNAATQQVFVAVRADASGLSLSNLQAPGYGFSWSTSKGWYRSLPAGEQAHLKPSLELGVLSLATALPSASDCSPGASSVLRTVDFFSGMDLVPPKSFDSLIVGMSFLSLPGKSGNLVVTGDGKVRFEEGQGRNDLSPPTPTPPGTEIGKRIMWRELVD